MYKEEPYDKPFLPGIPDLNSMYTYTKYLAFADPLIHVSNKESDPPRLESGFVFLSSIVTAHS